MDTEKRLSDFIKDGKSLLLSFPLYTRIKINTDIETKGDREIIDYDDEGIPTFLDYTYFYENPDYRFLKVLIFEEKHIYGYCPFCEKKLYLIHKGKILEEEYKNAVITSDVNINSQEMYEACVKYANEKFTERYTIVTDACLDESRNFTINLECTSKHRHTIQIIFHLSKDNYLLKVGQYPSIIDFERSNIKKYGKILKTFSREYYKAVFLKANNYGIASYVYLRRIFENLIIEKIDEKVQKDRSFCKEDFLKLHIDEKIEALKSDLPAFLISNKVLYGILSKGIHELTEDDCLKHFDTVKKAIEIILDEKIEQLEKQRNEQDTKNNLNVIANKIK